MTKIGVITDIHGDSSALKVALHRMKVANCKSVVCCGDLVDYGTNPDEVVEILKHSNITCVRGNHDRWALNDPTSFPKKVIEYISKLPISYNAVIEGIRILVCHATPKSDMDGIFENNTNIEKVNNLLYRYDTDIIVTGHTHIPMALYTNKGCIINAGTLLLNPENKADKVAMVYDPIIGHFIPYSLPVGGTYGVLELPSKEFNVYNLDGTPYKYFSPTPLSLLSHAR